VAVPPEVLVDSLESLGLGDLVQRNAVSVHAGALAAALRGLEREAAERGEDLPEIKRREGAPLYEGAQREGLLVSDITLHIGDVFEQLAKIPDGSIDLIVTSPPFLALRSYLPDDHPDKDLEIGSESGPAAFLDTMLALSAEWGRVLAPHGSLCVELGDTYSGSGGAGGDYNADGLRDGQQRFSGSAAKRAALGSGDNERPSRSGRGDDWPLSKSKTMLDTLYPACLAYGANLLSGEVSPAGRWRIRNLIVWARPNPPVGALGDKFRPATSYITVACKSPRRWFDLDAVRGAIRQPHEGARGRPAPRSSGRAMTERRGSLGRLRAADPAVPAVGLARRRPPRRRRLAVEDVATRLRR
jgi:hypothetical protein